MNDPNKQRQAIPVLHVTPAVEELRSLLAYVEAHQAGDQAAMMLQIDATPEDANAIRAERCGHSSATVAITACRLHSILRLLGGA